MLFAITAVDYNKFSFTRRCIGTMRTRKRPYSKSLANILAATNNGLQPLFIHAHRLQMLNRTLRGALGEPLGPHVSISNIREDTAIVSAESSAWLTQLKYLAPTVLHILQGQKGFESLRKVQFKVQPDSQTPEDTRPPRQASLSPSGANILNSAAEGIQDPDLAEALRRLALNASKKN